MQTFIVPRWSILIGLSCQHQVKVSVCCSIWVLNQIPTKLLTLVSKKPLDRSASVLENSQNCRLPPQQPHSYFLPCCNGTLLAALTLDVLYISRCRIGLQNVICIIFQKWSLTKALLFQQKSIQREGLKIKDTSKKTKRYHTFSITHLLCITAPNCWMWEEGVFKRQWEYTRTTASERETRLPSSYGFLTCLFANWVEGGGVGWGRGWTYGLLKHGLVVGRPRHPKGWSWRALVPVSLNSSRLDSQSRTAVLQELAAECSLSLPLPAAALTPTPILSQTQGEMLKRGRWRATGFGVYTGRGALAAAGKLTDTILLSLVPRVWCCAEPCCWGNRSPVPCKKTCWCCGPNAYGRLLRISVQISDTFVG